MSTLKIKTGDIEVSATLDVPPDPRAALLLAHGAGADHQHAHMRALADAFCQAGMVTLRFNFPFREAKKNRVDNKAVSVAAIADAASVLRDKHDLPLFIGGHSFGGRMATHAVAEGLVDCNGLILCSFPLHPAGKPGVERAAHLCGVQAPMLLLSGTRDALADADLLSGVVEGLEVPHQLHWLDTADHSFNILKRTRQSARSVYTEVSDVAGPFIERVLTTPG